jgi:type II secretory pathway predicted ATPase ExeA
LIGQTELRERLNRRPYQALRQRIGMQYHLGPLDAEETAAYVQYRLRVAGREAPLFDQPALALLHEHAGGVPRRINIIAANALVEGFGKESSTIGADIIESVVKDGV